MKHFRKLALGIGCATLLSGLALAQTKDAGRPNGTVPSDSGRPGSGGVNDGPKMETSSKTIYYVIGGIVVAAVVVFIATRPKKS